MLCVELLARHSGSGDSFMVVCMVLRQPCEKYQNVRYSTIDRILHFYFESGYLNECFRSFPILSYMVSSREVNSLSERLSFYVSLITAVN